MRRPSAVHRLEVRPFSSAADYGRVIDYFLNADEPYLRGMGVDPQKLPQRDAWMERLLPDLTRPDEEKRTFYLGWDYEGSRIGHCNLNPLRYGEQAHAHLHLWDADARRAGLGTEFFRQSIAVFFQRFALQRLYCEPYADNPAPNRVLSKAGFRLIKRYRTTPGLINFEQEVNQYVMDRSSGNRAAASVHDASEADLEGLVAIYNDVIAHSTAVFTSTPVSVEERRRWWQARTAQGYPVLVVRDERGVAGFASFGDFRAWPGYRFTVEHTLHVRADTRGRGLGTQLLGALIERAQALGKHVMIAGIDAENAASIRFHERLGFTQAGRLREVGHKFDHWLDLVFLQRSI